jgi:hypothetical protein
LGRHRIHQHRGRIGRGAAGDVESDRLDGAPAPAELDAQRVGEALVLRHLRAVKGFDAVARELQRLEGFGIAGFYGGVDFGRLYRQARRIQLQPVEFSRRLEQRRIAARSHVIDNGAGRGLDVGRDLALHREKRVKAPGKIGAAGVEANGHGAFSMARRQIAVNPSRS